jgi:uncharacterized alkaline shock family protein YloU
MSYFRISTNEAEDVIKKSVSIQKAVAHIPEDSTGVYINQVDIKVHNVCLPCDEVWNKPIKFCPGCNAEIKQLS